MNKLVEAPVTQTEVTFHPIATTPSQYHDLGSIGTSLKKQFKGFPYIPPICPIRQPPMVGVVSEEGPKDNLSDKAYYDRWT